MSCKKQISRLLAKSLLVPMGVSCFGYVNAEEDIQISAPVLQMMKIAIKGTILNTLGVPKIKIRKQTTNFWYFWTDNEKKNSGSDPSYLKFLFLKNNISFNFTLSVIDFLKNGSNRKYLENGYKLPSKSKESIQDIINETVSTLKNHFPFNKFKKIAKEVFQSLDPMTPSDESLIRVLINDLINRVE